MHEDTLWRLHTGFVPGPYNTRLYICRRPPTPDDFTLNLNVEVESLRVELPFSQPLPPPQYDLPPRRSHAAGTGLEESVEPHPEIQQTDRGGTFSFEEHVDGVLHIDCTRISKQGGTFSFQADVGVKLGTAIP